MIYLAVLIVSLLGTIMIRRFAIFDEPNARSAHTKAVPTGGGLAIVVAFYVGLFLLFLQGIVPENLFFALLGGVVLVVVSFIDDMVELSPKVRLFAQLSTIMIAFYFLDIFSRFHWFEMLLWGISLIWLINLYNFLDGIDGYAASEGIFVSLGAYLLYHDSLFMMMAIAIVGFLFFNWHRASIFMGDVGSTFIGFFFGILALYYYHDNKDLLVWGILLGIFIFDATITLLRRAMNKEKLTDAHKKHYFQRLVQSGFSHAEVVILAMGVNVMTFLLLYLLHKDIYLVGLFICYIVCLLFIAKIIDKKRPFI